MKLGDTLRVFRIVNDYSSKQAAELCYVAKSYICEIEKNKKNPSLDMLKVMAGCYNVPLSTLVRICELSEDEEWDFKKTLLEVAKIYVKE